MSLRCIVLAASLALLPARVEARAQAELGYRLDDAFSTTLRFVRVDRSCKVTDKDQDAAFIMFDCPLEAPKLSHGAIEIFRTTTNGREGVRIQVSLPDEPHGVELRMIELLERKLREERGTPRDVPKPPPPAPAPRDAGTN